MTIRSSPYLSILFLLGTRAVYLFFRGLSRRTLAMTLLDLPNELLLPIFSRLVSLFIYELVLNRSVDTHHPWDPVTTLQLVCKHTTTLVLSICRQVAALPAHDPLQTVDPLRSVPPVHYMLLSHLRISSPTELRHRIEASRSTHLSPTRLC